MIKYPETFKQKKPAGFDGVFEWDWLCGCFGDTKIMPMDFDGVVERKGSFLIFETKNEGVEIPQGQLITFQKLWLLHVFTFIFIVGKKLPETAIIWFPGDYCLKMEKREMTGLEEIKNSVKWWFDWANREF